MGSLDQVITLFTHFFYSLNSKGIRHLQFIPSTGVVGYEQWDYSVSSHFFSIGFVGQFYSYLVRI